MPQVRRSAERFLDLTKAVGFFMSPHTRRPGANVAEWILQAGHPDAPAIRSGDQTATYRELRRATESWASHLRQQGLAVGDRIGLWSENSVFFAAGYLGILRAGLCAVPFPIDTRETTFTQAAASTGLKRLLASARFALQLRPLAGRLGIPLDEETAPREGGPAADWPEIDPAEDLAAIMLTSGSTGEPKGVMVTHRNIESNTREIIDYLGLTAAERTMAVLPFYYCYGTSLLHTHLAAGASLVLNNRFMFPEKVLDEMEQKECTGFAGVPSTYQILLRKTRFARRQFPALQWMQQAGGKLPNCFIREIREAFPRVKFFVMYGQTEATARLSYLPPEKLEEKLGSIGRGLRGTRLEVLKEDGSPVRPGSEEVGEIVASGENITRGYWNDPGETARYFRQGKLYTGDMARVDEEGYIYIVERARDFIKAAGNRVSPKEIEEVLCEMPEVVEAAVIGVPDEIWGEAVRAFLALARPGQLSTEAIHQYCLHRLPNYKVPQRIEILPWLPKTANGKIAKEELRKMICNV
jgi:long-chain acyl-CoA synthetase